MLAQCVLHFSYRFLNGIIFTLFIFTLIFPYPSVSSVRKLHLGNSKIRHNFLKHPRYPYIKDTLIPNEKLDGRNQYTDKQHYTNYIPERISATDYSIPARAASHQITKLNMDFDSVRGSASSPPTKLQPCAFGRESSEGSPPKDPLTFCPDR